MEDLREERAAVRRTLESEFDVVGMEDFLGDPLPAIEVCLQQVPRADIVVVLAGWRYGHPANEAGDSYTECEYEQAKTLEIPVLAYLASDSMRSDGEEPLESLARQRDFRAKLEGSGYVQWPRFRDAQTLAEQAIAGVRAQFASGVRPHFTKHHAATGDPEAYSDAALIRQWAPLTNAKIGLVDLAALGARGYPKPAGRRMSRKMLDVKREASEAGHPLTFINTLPLPEGGDENLREQRATIAKRQMTHVVVVVNGEADAINLALFNGGGIPVMVFHPEGVRLSGDGDLVTRRAYTRQSFERCGLTRDVLEHIGGIVLMEVAKVLAKSRR